MSSFDFLINHDFHIPLVSMIAGVLGAGCGVYIAILGVIGGAGGTAIGGGAIALPVGSAAVGVGALIAVGGIHLSAQASENLKKNLDEYWKSRLNESRVSSTAFRKFE